jgi:hypothetical protein
MPVTKATPKKTEKNAAASKPAQRKAKRVTLDDMWALIAKIGEIHKRTEKTVAEISMGHSETRKILDEIGVAHKQTEKTVAEIGKGHSKTRKTLDEIDMGYSKTRKILDEISIAHEQTEKTLNKAISGLSNTLGSLVEHVMTPDLPRKFKEFGFAFDKITTVKWAADGSIYTQIDGLLENGDQAMVVEVKTTLRHDDIDDHVERMEKVRVYADDHGDRRKFLGAIAATIVDKSAREYALKKGLFVIEPSGESVKVTRPVSERIW